MSKEMKPEDKEILMKKLELTEEQMNKIFGGRGNNGAWCDTCNCGLYDVGTMLDHMYKEHDWHWIE